MNSLISVIKLKIFYILNLTLWDLKRFFLTKNYFRTTNYATKKDIVIYTLFIHFTKYLLGLYILYTVIVIYPLRVTNYYTYTFFIIGIYFLYLITLNIKNPIKSFKKDKFYAINFIKMDIRDFYVNEYIIKLLTNFITILLITLVHIKLFNINIIKLIDIVIIPYIYISTNNIIVLNSLFTKKNIIKKFLLLVLTLAVPISFYYYNIVGLLLITLLNIITIFKIKNYKQYERIYFDSYEKYKLNIVKINKYQQRINLVSSNNNYKNANEELFDKFLIRYKKILPKQINIKVVLTIILLISIIFLSIVNDYYKEYILFNIMYALNIITVILSLTNHSNKILKTMYTKLDSSFLNYNFYKEDKNVKQLYKIKFKYLLKQTSIAPIIMSLSLLLLYYLTSKELNILHMMILLIAPIIFNYIITMYYLLVYYITLPYQKNVDKMNFKHIVLKYAPLYISVVYSIYLVTLEKFIVILLILFVVINIISILSNKLIFKNTFINKT